MTLLGLAMVPAPLTYFECIAQPETIQLAAAISAV